jgi:hypothetical protein
MKTLKFKIEMDVEDEVKESDLREYIADACRSWGGQFHRDDPLFGLEETQIRVTRYIKEGK